MPAGLWRDATCSRANTPLPLNNPGEEVIAEESTATWKMPAGSCPIYQIANTLKFSASATLQINHIKKLAVFRPPEKRLFVCCKQAQLHNPCQLK
jgi:hypothetical protein